jgi:hypothetical protein
VVSLTNANTARPSFTMPKATVPLVFQVTVTGPGGSATDTVSITDTLDTIDPASLRVEYDQSKAQWRIDGTVSILSNNTVSAFLGTSANGPFIGQQTVDPTLGTFDIRVRPSSVQPTASTVFIQTSRGATAIALVTLK